MEAVKYNMDPLKFVEMKYVKFIKKYLKSINHGCLHDELKFIINKNLNDFIKYYEDDENCNGWAIKYSKQNLSLCKLVIKHDYYLSYVNYTKPKLCVQIIKTFNEGFQYIKVLL